MASEHHRSSALIFGLIVLLLVLAIISAVITAILVFSERNSSSAMPVGFPLVGDQNSQHQPGARSRFPRRYPRSDDCRAAPLTGGKPDTALATLLYSTSLSDQVRVTGLLTLSGRFAADNKKDSAALAAATAVDVAILSPTIPDYSKAALLAEAGQALAARR